MLKVLDRARGQILGALVEEKLGRVSKLSEVIINKCIPFRIFLKVR